MNDLPLIRQSERVDFKRCHKKWYWRWRKGLVPQRQSYGALSLGTWIHTALQYRYTALSKAGLRYWFKAITDTQIAEARSAIPPVAAHDLATMQELAMLGLAMSGAYDKHYGKDPDIVPVDAEIPLEFEFSEGGKLLGSHKLKPDLLFHTPDDNDALWLMEHKTAKQIRLGHLPLDDQARGYAAMAEAALRKAGWLQPGQYVKGVMYNFLRKALPDDRKQDAQGRYLNQNGTLSKRQPTPIFIRHPIVLSKASKLITLNRIQGEVYTITRLTQAIRGKRVDPKWLQKTPHSSCEKLCPFFSMCVAEEQGHDVREMEKRMFVRKDPYQYEEDTADIPLSFELS